MPGLVDASGEPLGPTAETQQKQAEQIVEWVNATLRYMGEELKIPLEAGPAIVAHLGLVVINAAPFGEAGKVATIMMTALDSGIKEILQNKKTEARIAASLAANNGSGAPS